MTASTRAAAFSTRSPRTRCWARAKLITEPWDLGPGGYQLGAFPHPFLEFNDRFRDGVRRFWKGETGVAELSQRLAGSAQQFDHSGRAATSSINFVTVHDGFTLEDLVCYNAKHNEANGEDNRDGTDDNYSDNMGVEGVTDTADHRRRPRPAQAQPAGQRAAQPGHAVPAGRRRDRQFARAATTTPSPRTTRSAGSTGRPATSTSSASSSG